MRTIARDEDAVAAALDDALAPVLAAAARAQGRVRDRLSATQLQALVLLADAGPTNLSGLAEAMRLLPSSATRLVQRMVAAGLVQREQSPADRREVVLRCSTEGLGLLQAVRAARREELAAALRRLPVREREAVLRGAQALGGALEPQVPVERAPAARRN